MAALRALVTTPALAHRWHGQVQATIDARTRALAPLIERELRRYGVQLGDELARAYLGGRLRVAKDDRRPDRPEGWSFERYLLELITHYGIRQYDEAGRRAAESVDGQWLVEPTWLTRYMRTKEVRIQRLAEDTRQAARDSVAAIVAQALGETPRPSPGEIARRIRNQFHGTAAGTPLRTVDVTEPGILETSRIWTADGSLYAFSSERAALIARTELAQAENTGIYRGYELSAVDELEWLGYPNDGRSGKRAHWRLRGVRVKLGEYFTTPLGNRLRYPCDPEAPIAETANCRCSQAPHRSGR